MKTASLFLLFALRSAFSLTVRTFHQTPRTLINIKNADASNPTSTTASSLHAKNDKPGTIDPEFGSISRRSALSRSAQSLAAILLANTIIPSESALADIQYTASPKTILITGCNSGIGYDAVKRMAKQGHEIILACRTFDKANDTVTKIQQELENPNLKLIPKECNLADLNSVKSCVEGLVNDGIKNIDALCLNAGIARNTAATDVLRTAQGFEATIGTNHLGHFYLTNQILPLMGKNSNIIVTASSVHDPDSPGGAQGSKATLGNLVGLEAAVKNKDGVFDMVDGQPFDADKAYKDSKLCNIFFFRELQRRLESSGSGVKVNAFTPGLIVSTGLFRDQNPIFTKLFDFVATDLVKVGESIHFGGGALEYMTLDDGVASKSGLYYFSPPGSSKYGDAAYGNQFTPTDVSTEAHDDAKGRRLWELSEQLVGIKSA